MTSSNSRREFVRSVFCVSRKFEPFFQLVVFGDGLEIYRAHGVELSGHLLDHFAQLLFVERRSLVDRFGQSALFYLCAIGFCKSVAIGRELAQIDLITPHDVFGEILDLELHLGLAHFLLAACVVQVAQSFALAPEVGFEVAEGR